MNFAVTQARLKRANQWKLFGLCAALTFVFVALIAVDNLLVSALIGLMISYTVGPLVNYLERQGIGRTLATSFVFIAVGIMLALIGTWLAPYCGETLLRLQGDMPRFIGGLGAYISELEGKVQLLTGPLSNFDLQSKVEGQLTSWTRDFFTHLPGYLKTIFTVMVLGPFLAFFMVKDGRQTLRGILGVVPNQLFETALSLLHQINFQIGQFVRARLLEGVIVAMVTAIGLMLVGFPYAFLLGAVAGITNLIPYLGPLIGALPALVIALVNGHTGLGLFLVIAVYVVAQLIDAGILIPMLVAKIVDLHPVTVIVVIIAGSQLMGILGMIISIPVASTLKVTISTIYRHLIDTRT